MLQVENKTRDDKGRLLPGHSANPLGRPRLPDWFKGKGLDAIRVLSAAATGTVDDLPDPPPAALQVASESSVKERIAAATELANRVYGKAPDVITGDPDSPVSLCLEVRFRKPGE